MAERTSATAAQLAFADLVDALARYLHATGWEDLRIGLDASRVRILERGPDPGIPVDDYDFRVPFTGRFTERIIRGTDFTERPTRGSDR